MVFTDPAELVQVWEELDQASNVQVSADDQLPLDAIHGNEDEE